jgi:hypothetical protein
MTSIESKKNKKVFLKRSKKEKKTQKGGQNHPKHFYNKSYDNIIKKYNNVKNEIKRIDNLIKQSNGDTGDLQIILNTYKKKLDSIKMENNNSAKFYIEYCEQYFDQKNILNLETERINNSKKSFQDIIIDKEIIFKLITKPVIQYKPFNVGTKVILTPRHDEMAEDKYASSGPLIHGNFGIVISSTAQHTDVRVISGENKGQQGSYIRSDIIDVIKIQLIPYNNRFLITELEVPSNSSIKYIKELLVKERKLQNNNIEFVYKNKILSENTTIDQIKYTSYFDEWIIYNYKTYPSILAETIVNIKLKEIETQKENMFEIRGDTTIAKLKNLLGERLKIPPYKIEFIYEKETLLNYITIENINYKQSKYISYWINQYNTPTELTSENPNVKYEYVSSKELKERFEKMEISEKQLFIQFLDKMNLKTVFLKIKNNTHTDKEYNDFLRIMYINNFVKNIQIDTHLFFEDVILIPIYNNQKPVEPDISKMYLVKEFNSYIEQLHTLHINLYMLNKDPIKNKDSLQQMNIVLQALNQDIHNFISKNGDIFDYIVNLKKYEINLRNESVKNTHPKFSRIRLAKFFTTYHLLDGNKKIWNFISADQIRKRFKSLNIKEQNLLISDISKMDNALLIFNKIKQNDESFQNMITLYNILIEYISFLSIEIILGGDDMEFIPYLAL